MAGETKWCASCGAEYRQHVTECADCAVQLVDELPVVDHSIMQWDLRTWEEDQLQSLFRMLRTRELAFDWDLNRGVLQASPHDEQQIDDILAFLDESADVDEDELLEALDAPPPAEIHESLGTIAGLGQRIGGWFIDTLLFTGALNAGSIAAFGSASPARRSLFFGLIVSNVFGFLYAFVCVAVWGRTLGKFLVGTEVVDYASGEKASTGAAARRAVLPAAVALVPFVGPIASFAIYLAVAIDEREHRGLHDRFAATVVVRADRR